MSRISKRKKRRLKARRNNFKKSSKSDTQSQESKNTKTANTKQNIFKNIYKDHYKKILIFPLIILILSFLIIGMNIVNTGDFIQKGVSLKGGTTLTVQPQDTQTFNQLSVSEITQSIKQEFPNADVNTRSITSAGELIGVAIDVDLEIDQIDRLIEIVEEKTGELATEDYVVESIGSSLGESFFKEILRVLLFAFLAMALVVFLYFRVPIPSLYVVLSAFTDILVTIAVLDLFGVKISTAGIAAFLMLVGYSVDTDILLTIRVLKSKKGSVFDRTIDAMKTGLTMSATTLSAVTLAFFFATSDTIKQIMLILIIGLLVDIMSTWLQNAPLLRWYLEKRNKK